MALYDLNRKISAGVGIGTNRYEEPGNNTLLMVVFLTIHRIGYITSI